MSAAGDIGLWGKVSMGIYGGISKKTTVVTFHPNPPEL
jgi:hypothetical protein